MKKFLTVIALVLMTFVGVALLGAQGVEHSRSIISGLLQFGGTTSAFPALKRNGTRLDVRLADDSGDGSVAASTFIAVTNLTNGTSGRVFVHMGAPTISSGFGTTPSIVASNGTASFTINVGTGGVATSGLIGLRAATTGWNCFATDPTTNIVTRETATTTTTATLTAASAWAASDILQVSCFAY